jgi:hypothetical protein
MCEIVDIVPVSTEQPLGDDQEQLFEEEEDCAVAEEGKWSSPLAYSIFLSYLTSFTINFTFMKYCINLTGTPFLRTYLDILP